MDRHSDAATPIANVFTFPPREPVDRPLDALDPVEPEPGCPCLVCRAFESASAIRQLEIIVMDEVGDLLDAGWPPEALVDEVDRRSLRGPCAAQIVTLAIVSHAGFWPGVDSLADLLDEVNELTAGFNHLVGLTVAGWLDRYAHEQVDLSRALAGVVDVLDTLDTLPRPSVPWKPGRSGEAGPVWATWRQHRC